MNKRIREKLGQVFKVPLGDGTVAFGQVTGGELHTFFDLLKKEDEPVTVEEVVARPVLFRISVVRAAITKGFWPVIGILPPAPALLEGEDQYAYKTAFDKYTICKKEGGEIPATWEECKHLESFSVWDVGAVEQRLRDHFAGRPCWYLESNKPGWERISAKEFYKQYGFDFNFLDNEEESS